MIHIIAGTNRPGARSLIIANIIEKLLTAQNTSCEIIDLASFDFSQLIGKDLYSDNQSDLMLSVKQKLNSSRGFYFVVPEYNGSMPGILKYFIDHWSYPETFEYRPMAFVGLGGLFGGLRPVEHLQQVMGYRNAYQFPERVFIHNVWSKLDGHNINDKTICNLLERQSRNFVRFIAALESQGLVANNQSRDN